MELSVRIVSLDYYMAKPLPGLDVCFSPLEGTPVERVPIVRIFGSTPSGQKTCLHLHKVGGAAIGTLRTSSLPKLAAYRAAGATHLHGGC